MTFNRKQGKSELDHRCLCQQFNIVSSQGLFRDLLEIQLAERSFSIVLRI